MKWTIDIIDILREINLVEAHFLTESVYILIVRPQNYEITNIKKKNVRKKLEN